MIEEAIQTSLITRKNINYFLRELLKVKLT